jgi:hypothetical protein
MKNRLLFAVSVAMLLLFVAVCEQSWGQRRSRDRNEKPRDLKVMVRDSVGNMLDFLPVFASITGADKEASFPRIDRLGYRYFTVRESDSVDLFVHNRLFRFAVAGLDSVGVTVHLSRIDSINYIEPVVVTAVRNRKIETGYGTIDPQNFTGAGANVDMTWAENYPDLSTFLRARVAGLIIVKEPQGEANAIIRGSNKIALVVDGIAMDTDYWSFDDINALYMPQDIESIFVMKGSYGLQRDVDGAIIITTKKGVD